MDDADLLVACPDTLRDRGERFTRIVGSEGQTRRLTFEVVGYREMLVRGKAPDGAAFYYFRKAEVVRCVADQENNGCHP